MEDKPSPQDLIIPESALSVNFTATAVAELSNQRKMLRQFISSQLKAGVDYGIIPGTKKPTLYKPGAEKLANLFHLGSRIVNTEREFDRKENFAMFTYTVEVFHLPTGKVISQCQGSANSQEKKYKTRPAMDVVNTLQKMAQKRAFVGAIIAATGASDFFTQDLEDLAPDSRQAEEVSARIRASRPPVEESDAPVCCGQKMMISKFVNEEIGHKPWYCRQCRTLVPREDVA